MKHITTDAMPMPEPTPQRPNDGSNKGRHAGQQPQRNGLSYPKNLEISKLQATKARDPKSPVQPPAEKLVDVDQLPQFFRRDDPNRIHPSAVESLRQKLLTEIGPLKLPALQKFVEKLFADDLVVESYFRPMAIGGKVGRAFKDGGYPLEALPWCEAKRAAQKSSLFSFFDDKPQEKEFVAVASWALPAGMFMLSHPSVKAKGEVLRNFHQVRVLTGDIVSDAIKAMSRISDSQGRVMKALIGQGGTKGCHPCQLSRLGSALYLSQVNVNELWAPATGWVHTNGKSHDDGDSEF